MGDTKKPISSDDLFKIVSSDKEPVKSTKISAENFADILKNAPQAEGLSWTDVPLKALANIPTSALNVGKGIYHSVTHPIETASSILDIAAGGLHNLTPKQIADFIDKHDQNPEAIKRAVEAADIVGKTYKERYGSGEGFKQALANDPVGVALDVSTLLSGGAGIAGKAGLPAKAVGTLEKAAEYTNPISGAAKLVSTVGKPMLGISTGTGSENIVNAAKAGFNKDESLLKQMRGEAPMNEPLDNARHNLEVMRQNKSKAYRSGMADVSKDKSVLDFAEIDNALANAKKEISYGSKIKDDVAHDYIKKMEEEITDWKNSPADMYHTPEGLDALKQRIGAINNRIPYEEANSNRIGGNIYNSIKKTITDQAPTYSKVMGDYSEASDAIQQIEKALSLGSRASADTALRKLQSLTRNNVNTNYGQRLNLAQQLEAEGGKPFINALSGQALSSNAARGLAGVGEGMTAATGLLLNPYALAALPFQTPRIVGEGLYAGGRGARGISDVANRVGLTPSKGTALADMLYMQDKESQENPYKVDLTGMANKE
jgi:hypothetical protein